MDRTLIRDRHHGQGNYLHPLFQWFIDPSEVSSIVEIGSRDAIDALDLSAFFQCHVFAFECNPMALEICKHNSRDNPRVTVVPLAAWNREGMIPFYPILPGEKGFNLGMSSCFKMDSVFSSRHQIQQGETQVEAVRMDTWLQRNGLEGFDLVCMDVEGASLEVLEGFGTRLSKAKYLIVELGLQEIYQGEALYSQVVNFLRAKGFRLVVEIDKDGVYVDALFAS